MAGDTIEQALHQARQLQAAGRLEEAAQLCRQMIAAAPRHAEAHNALGEIFQSAGRGAEATAAFEAAVRFQPDFARAHANLGAVLAGAGRYPEALMSYLRAVALKPTFAEGHATLGSLMAAQGRLAEAVAEYQEALYLKPDLPEVRFWLGRSLYELGKLTEAETFFRAALQERPSNADTHNNLGGILKATGRHEEAARHFREALALRPDFAEAHANLGSALELSGRFEDALVCHRRAVSLQPTNAEMQFRLGVTLAGLRRHEEALAALDGALTLQPNHSYAWNHKGIALRMLGRIDEAAEAFRRGTAGGPGVVDAWSNLGVVLDLKGERKEALACYRRAVELKPDDAAAHSNLLYALHFHPDVTPRQLLEEHRAWERHHAAALRPALPPVRREKPAPLRIGYVSPDFRDHPVGRFMAPLIAAHDPAAVEVVCYADVLKSDGITERIAGACRWRPITGLSDAQAAELIRGDQIDILVDLTMHMAGNRQLVFARRPAPVQVTYLAYCSTTGLGTMDYRLTDPLLDPPEADMSCYVEKSMHIPHYWCYAAPPEAPPPNEAPCASAPLTFGCLNGFNKVSDEALAVWGRILRAVPGSRLLLHANPGSHRQRVWDFLRGMGVEPQRCEFIGLGDLAGYFTSYHQIDIALDPFPYAGGTTTCDALWMGVPVVTLRGERAVGRGGVSILSSLGLQAWIADSTVAYEAIAARLAGDADGRVSWRRRLRGIMLGSPLVDAPAFARSIEAAYRQMWDDSHSW